MSHFSVPGLDLEAAFDSVPAKVAAAARLADSAISGANVRHLFCGGLAVAAWGYKRSTQDVDFLVGDEAFDHHGKIVSHKAGIPIMVDGVVIDLVTIPKAQTLVESELNSNKTGVVSLHFLVLMKLIAYRARDKNDIVELFRLDADRPNKVRMALAGVLAMNSDLLTRLNNCVEESYHG